MEKTKSSVAKATLLFLVETKKCENIKLRAKNCYLGV